MQPQDWERNVAGVCPPKVIPVNDLASVTSSMVRLPARQPASSTPCMMSLGPAPKAEHANLLLTHSLSEGHP